MRTRARLTAGLLACLASALLPLGPRLPGAAAEDPPGRISEKEHKRRHSKLRNAAGRWITNRKAFPSRCPTCQGSGKRKGYKNGRLAWVPCKQCGARGAWVSDKHYRAVYFDMRTPAFRALPGIEDTLNKQYIAARSGKPWPSIIKRYRLRDREMVDDTHGIVWFLLNASKAPTATYWIWASKSKGGKSAWFQYDARADGPWPASREDNAPIAPGASRRDSPWQPLPADESRALRNAITQARLTFRAFESSRRGNVLRIRLKPWSDTKGRKPADRVGPDAVRLMRAVFASMSGWERIEAEWRARWRDPYGRIDLRPTWHTQLTRSAYDAALWNTRTLEEQVRLLDWQDVTHEGWQALEGTRPSTAPAQPTPTEPTPTEPTPTEPTPTEPTPTEPTPTEPTPTEPTPVEPRPVPPTPQPTPPSTAPQTFDLPKLTAKAEREARKGLARMQALFELAKGVHDEGVLAHREGAHDLWQEKLSEARGHLEEIEEAWLEDVVAHMPGADEGEQDAVANEHFGDVWDDIYKLKAMVRKMSSLR